MSIAKSVQSLANAQTQEKRLQALIYSIQELLESQEISQVTYVPTDINIADEMTKGKSGNQSYHLLHYNMLKVTTKEAIFNRYKRAHTNKQYLIHERHFSELKGDRH